VSYSFLSGVGPKGRLASVAAILLTSTGLGSGAFGATVFDWQTVVNNGFLVPGGTTQTFFSYNQPSISRDSLVVFRARARNVGGGGGGGSGEPFRGIYSRDMSLPDQPVVLIADNKTTVVPDPNNLDAGFNEFPSFPRVDVDGTIAFRGQSSPVWTYTDASGADTRAGTSGVYTTAGGSLVTGASQLGAVPGFDYFAVPGSASAGTKFDQFPGAPSPSGDIVAFKGNWTDGAAVGHTGIYVRNALIDAGKDPVRLIAESGMAIPNEGGTPGSGAVFGSTAPPSVSGKKIVFTGLDNEDAPTAGGIYIADIVGDPNVKALVDFSTGVPGEAGQTFNQVGEALSFNRGKVGFWGAWGDEKKTVTLTCGSDGNAAVIAACIESSDRDPVTGEPTGTTTREVPVHQGIFNVDAKTGIVQMVAQTGDPGIGDLLFWNFSGAPPGVGEGEGDREPPRWRSTAFVAVDGGQTIFKATGDSVDSLILGRAAKGILSTLLDTTMLASILDPEAPLGALIASLGIERDGFRGGHFAINAGFLNAADESWAGIYTADVAPIPLPFSLPLLAGSMGALALVRRRRRSDPT
jgi:hypothetical protein